MELKLGSIPLRIHAGFFLMAVFLGMTERDPARLAVWVATVLVSVIVHELGHALMGRAFGLVPRIELHGMGGHTSFTGGPTTRGEVGTAKSIAISVAGPFAGFLFAAVVLVLVRAGLHPKHPVVDHAVTLLVFVNVVWGIFNLVPMLPLDGGNVLRAALRRASKTKGEKIARVVSIAIALALVLWSIGRQEWWLLYLGVLYGFQNVQAIRQAGQQRVDQGLVEVIEKGYAALERRQPKEAIALLAPALAVEGSPELRQVGLRIYVAAMLQEARWTDAMEVIARERKVIGAEDLSRYADAMREVGRDEDAQRIEAFANAPAPLSEFRA